MRVHTAIIWMHHGKWVTVIVKSQKQSDVESKTNILLKHAMMVSFMYMHM